MLEDGHKLLRDLLIHIEPKRELTPEKTYEVSILGIMAKKDYEDDERRERCQLVLNQLESHLAQCSNIVVKDNALESADEAPISYLDYYDPWDFDYLSVRDSG